MNERQKNSLILGGIASSAGVFITKVIGILYVVPFAALATEANLSYYARAYNVYEMVLNVSISGLPFAIATLVAKYMLKENYKTVLLVRKLSTAVLAILGFVMMISLVMLAQPIAQISIAGAADSKIGVAPFCIAPTSPKAVPPRIPPEPEVEADTLAGAK